MTWKQDLRTGSQGKVRDDGASVRNVGTPTKPIWQGICGGWLLSGSGGKIRQFATKEEAMKAVDREP